uniref:Uncharacterized protein n=1 Tax=Anguilla anguilla TaxID=7936 RepID=A0A0E9XD58_ANGAN
MNQTYFTIEQSVTSYGQQEFIYIYTQRKQRRKQ